MHQNIRLHLESANTYTVLLDLRPDISCGRPDYSYHKGAAKTPSINRTHGDL